jgi:hypothetical protein
MSPICPTCGCSLVRLDLKREDAARYEHRGEEVRFCRCPHCVEEFHRRPAELLARLAG